MPGTRVLTDQALKLINLKFKEKQGRTPVFSLRAFAKYLKISPTALSEGLRGHRNFSEQVIRKMAAKLQLTTHETASILAKGEVEFELLDEKKFESISDWEFLAVLNMASLKGFEGTPEWIADRLGIALERATFVFDRLIDLGYLYKEEGQWKRIHKKLHSSSAIPMQLITKCLLQDHGIVKRSFTETPLSSRDSSALTLVLTPENFREAQILIRKFRMDLVSLSEKQGMYDIDGEVYKLCTHLVPLSEKKPKLKS